MARSRKTGSAESEVVPAGERRGSPSGFSSSQSSGAQNVRETIESIVIAFVLAFLFRTFEAEAFVIPTGSMAPTLMGRHKDVYCTQCGHRFRTSASEEYEESVVAMRRRGDRRAAEHDCLAGVCPMCRYTMPVRPDLRPATVDLRLSGPLQTRPSYNGDRILVNKYAYSFADPERWDVIVFKYPGNAQINYIKRLVGLPGETLRILHGDLYVGPPQANDDQFEIARKPVDKFLVMRQLVHDTDYEPSLLIQGGWPLRWSIENGSQQTWEETTDMSGQNVRRTFRSREHPDLAWIRYRNYLPDHTTWRSLAASGTATGDADAPRASLINDFNAYNARVMRMDVGMQDLPTQLDAQGRRLAELAPLPNRLGLHWVGDLMLEADVTVASEAGLLWLDLVEGGRHFQCRIDIATGEASLLIPALPEFSAKASCSLQGPGSYRVALANYDDQLVLWVDDKLVPFATPTSYDGGLLFGNPRKVVPTTSDEDPGDLAPAGVGVERAQVTVSRLRVYRDIYYIADDWRRNRSNQPVTDLDEQDWRQVMFRNVFADPSLWGIFANRRSHEFSLGKDQFFVMGDNSPESLDSRLWKGSGQSHSGRPGGAYLERDLLIGKALCVYWPHSWNQLPGVPIPFPMFPNFADMRLVR